MELKRRFQKVAHALVAQVAHQIMRLLEKGSLVDMYYSFEEQLIHAQMMAYEDGYKKGRQEVLDSVKLFDESKDPTEN